MPTMRFFISSIVCVWSAYGGESYYKLKPKYFSKKYNHTWKSASITKDCELKAGVGVMKVIFMILNPILRQNIMRGRKKSYLE